MSVTARVGRFGLLIGVLLAVPSRTAEAEQFVCSPIARGDTAFRLALRLTGTSTSVYSDRFQIRDPARGLFVPKSQYQRLNPRWQACVARQLPVRESLAAFVEAPAARREWREPQPQHVPAYNLVFVPPQSQASAYDLTLMWQVGATVSILLFGCAMVFRYMPDRAIPPDMERAGEQFVAAFARPLIDPASNLPPIRARFRFVRRTQHLEIRLAPNAGRRYPNLSDHRTNVEYDVDRIARLIGTHVVVNEGVRAEGQWVVVPIRRADVKEAGAK